MAASLFTTNFSKDFIYSRVANKRHPNYLLNQFFYNPLDLNWTSHFSLFSQLPAPLIKIAPPTSNWLFEIFQYPFPKIGKTPSLFDTREYV